MVYFICDSLLTLCLPPPEIFISTYPKKLVFGKVENFKYLEHNRFEFDYYEFHHLYTGIIDIIKAISSETPMQSILFQKSALISYKWELSNKKNNFAFNVL